jgi:hypothetical protein
MLAIEVVDKVREKLNENSINDNIAFDDSRIILAVNEAQNRFIEWIYEKKNEDDIRLIQKFLQPSSLQKHSDDEISSYFSLPADYFEFVNLKSKAKKSECIGNLLLFEVKSFDYNELLHDINNMPSFEYRESFYYIQNNKVRIFKADFEVISVVIDYYRYPKKIDVQGYINIDNTPSVESHPEWDDRTMDRIINIAVRDLNINSDNLQKTQADNFRIQSEF